MKKKNNNLTLSYSLLHFCFQIISVCIIGYSSYYLLGCGFKNTEIGILIAISNIVAVLLQPLIGNYADKPESPSLKKIMLFLFGLYLLAAVFLFILNGNILPLVAIVFGFCSMMFQILLPFLNSLGTESMNQGKNISFGVARGMGSLAYAISSYILGMIVIPFGISVIPVIVIGVLSLILIALFLFPFEKPTRKNPVQEQSQSQNGLAFFRKYKSFTYVLIGCICFYINHTLLNNFLFQIVENKGGTTSQMGTATAIAAVLELPIMFGFHFLLKKVSASKWILVSGIFYTVKAIGSLLVPNMFGFYFVQVFQMFSWATIAVSTVYYVNDVMQEEDTIKGQSYMGMTFTLGTILGSVVGGVLLDYTSVNTMLIFAILISAIGSVVVAHGLRQSKNPEA